MTWFSIKEVDPPNDTPLLVWLSVPELGMQVHGGMYMKISNDVLPVIGHYFISDLEGEVTHWMYPPEGPEQS